MQPFTWTCCNKTYSKRNSALKHWQRVHDGSPDDFPVTSRRGQRSHEANNLLWVQITSSWSTLPSNHPHFPKGIALLHYFKAMHVPVHRGITQDILDAFTTEPKAYHINNDVIASTIAKDNTISSDAALLSTASGDLETRLTKGHLFAALETMAQAPSSLDNSEDLCAILNLQPTIAGLLGCKPRVPSAFHEYGITKSPTPEISTAYTPRGHVTDLHIDSMYEGTVVTTLLGRKVLFQWPPSEHNLGLIKRFHWLADEWLLYALYDKLIDVKITLCHHGTTEYIPPGGFHAVLSLDNSAMTGYGIVHPSMLSDVDRLAAWELEHASDLQRDGDPHHGIPTILASHKNDLNTWMHLINKHLMTPYRPSIVALHQRLSDAMTKLSQ